MRDRIDWKYKIVPRVKETLIDRRSRGIPKASIRGIFYNLISLDLVPNVPGVYKQLSKALVKAREDGAIPDDWIVDDSRSIVDIDDEYNSPEEIVDGGLDFLVELPDDYKNKIPRWYNQPIYVEIWIEKKAMAAVFQSILDEEGRQVRIVSNSGWSSRTFWVNNINRLIQKSGHLLDTVVILYYGDYDPSGCKMIKKYKKLLAEKEIILRVVAITKEQIRQFQLEHLKNTDPVVLAKLNRDKNAAEFRKENNGELFQIEIDALDALRPDDLRRLVLDTVDEYFDEEIYQEVLNDQNHQPEEIRRLISKKLIAYVKKAGAEGKTKRKR